MGTTAEKLTYLNTTKGLIKDSINALGGNLTNESTFRSYAAALDSIYNVLPKTTGTGSTLSLTPTLQGKLVLDLKGNTKQTTETGNLFDKDNANILKVNLSNANNISGTSNSNRTLYIPVIPNTTYVVSKAISNYFVIGTTETTPTFNLAYYQRQSDATASSLTITTNSTAQYLVMWYWNSSDTLTEQQILDSIVIKATTNVPSPTYPQDVNVVSGDNSITINDNIKTNGTIYNYSFNASTFTESSFNRTLTIPIEENTTYYITKSMISNRFRICLSNDVPSSSSVSVNEYSDVSSLTSTSITNTTYKYLNIFYWTNSDTYTKEEIYDSLQVYTQSQTYPINLPIENFFDKDTRNWYRNNGSAFISEDNTSTTRIRTDAFAIEGNKTYTLSGIPSGISLLAVNEYNTYGGTRSNYISSSGTFTLSQDTTYIALIFGGSDFTDATNTLMKNANIQLEYGSKANTYTPYGTTPIELCKIGTYQDYFYKDSGKWYLHKETSKVIFDGSENEGWYIDSTGTANWSYRKANSFTNPIRNTGYSNYYPIVNITNANTSQGLGVRDSTNNNEARIRWGTEDTIENFKTWLQTHNVIVYYALATPTNIEITYTSLINQLDAIRLNALSYNGTTNILQTNNDLPFIIEASCLKGA